MVFLFSIDQFMYRVLKGNERSKKVSPRNFVLQSTAFWAALLGL